MNVMPCGWRLPLWFPGVELLHVFAVGESVPLDRMEPLLRTLSHLKLARQSHITLQTGVLWNVEIHDSNAGAGT